MLAKPAGRDARSTARLAMFVSASAVAASCAGVAVAQDDVSLRAPPLVTVAPALSANADRLIPHQYIVVFAQAPAGDQKTAAERRTQVVSAQERVKQFGGLVLQTYSSALVGFSVRLPDNPEREKAALEALRASPGVAFIEQDQIATYNTIQPPNPPGAPPTGIDRIDRRLLALNSTYTYSETGAGVNAYVIDSGMRITHNEFSGRATNGFTVAGTDFTDCAPHGTHVAGTIGAETFGVAKDVNLINVRVGSAGTCTPTAANVIAGVDWVTANRVLPAVANLSLTVGASAATDLAVNNSLAAGVFYAVAAGNANVDACGASPARIPNVMTVGATFPATDARATGWSGGQASNFGPCLDLFAPGDNILSSWSSGDNATATISGTSMASPHVAGVAARYLQTYPAATPAQVTTAILAAANTAATPGWGGVTNAGVGSPNVLLHYGSLDDGVTDGDPHIRTTDGVNYDFQSAGEFTLLRDNGLEIQTRQTPVSTQPPIANPHTGLAACVSLNSAVAASVAGRRVSYQPGGDRMVLRIDGTETPVTAAGVTLGAGARVSAGPAGNGIVIDFPDGTGLSATPNFWGAPHNRWYLNISVFGTRASEGIMGDIAPGSWLPALSSGASLGPKPASLPQRFVDLYQTFADSWRVSGQTSLFDYEAGESAAGFAIKDWPPQSGTCVIPDAPTAKGMPRKAAIALCRPIRDKGRNANCVFDVAVTGDSGFAKAYAVSERIEAGATKTDIGVAVRSAETVTLVADVKRRASGQKGVPAGSVQFVIDGQPYGKPVGLDGRGMASIEAKLAPGKHRLSAEFTPLRRGALFPSASAEEIVVTGKGNPEGQR